MYRARILDGEVEAALLRSGGVLIEGPKACGKTATASQYAASVIHLDTDPSARAQAEFDPTLILEGERPRLLDEWQTFPAMWNVIRRDIDATASPGQFLLTGSTAPAADAVRHSGAGRIARLAMRTMTLFESGHADGAVSFEQLAAGNAPRAVAPPLSSEALFTRMVSGGWPGFLALQPAEAAANVRDYAETVAAVDIGFAGRTRDPRRVLRLMRALARSTATEVSVTTLARDETTLSRDAVREYLDALSRVFVVEDQPAWSAHLRSSATLRKEPKRHFADPSIAAALVGVDSKGLLRNLPFAGQLFESLVVHELRVYAQRLRASVFHARDSAGREIDAIVQWPSGDWCGVEVKLGANPETIDDAARGLLSFASNVEVDPVALTVVTSAGPSYRRADGVNVVAIGSLGP